MDGMTASENTSPARALQQLQKGAGAFKSVFAPVDMGICILDIGLHILFANQWIEERFPDYLPLEGRHCYEIFRNPRNHERFCPLHQCFETGDSHSHVIEHAPENAPVAWYEVTAWAVRDPGNGAVIGGIEIFRDITAWKEAEEALQESEALFRTVMEQSPVAFGLLDTSGLLVQSNPAWETLWGESPDRQRNRWNLLRDPELSETGLLIMIERALAGEDLQPRVLELNINDRDTSPRPLALQCRVWSVRGHDEMIVHAVIVLEDITERRQHEEQLLQIREALEDCGSAVLIMDRKGVPTYINTAFGELFGYTLANAREIDLETLFASTDRGIEIFGPIMDGVTWAGEITMRDAGGREFPASLRASPILDEDYEIAGVFFILNDITTHKQMESQLIQSQNLKSIGQLAAGIAHEINTPMQYVGDNTRFLQEGVSDMLDVIGRFREFLEKTRKGEISETMIDELEEAIAVADIDFLEEDIPRAIEQSLEGISRVVDIVRAMRQFTHPGTGEKKQIDINQAIESTVTVARNEWRYAAEMELLLDREMPPVPCLPGELNQVFLNLIVNAAHAIAEKNAGGSDVKGRITISTRVEGAWAEIRIADTGSGIPEEAREHIFDPFFTTKEVGSGTGQGLSISHAVIVEQHGGSLTFETETGRGATFLIRLPLHAAEENTGGNSP
jgi:PAS domain S-box-containing protein